MSDNLRAFEEGRRAAGNLEPASVNPYPKSIDLHGYWQEGYELTSGDAGGEHATEPHSAGPALAEFTEKLIPLFEERLNFAEAVRTIKTLARVALDAEDRALHEKTLSIILEVCDDAWSDHSCYAR